MSVIDNVGKSQKGIRNFPGKRRGRRKKLYRVFTLNVSEVNNIDDNVLYKRCPKIFGKMPCINLKRLKTQSMHASDINGFISCNDNQENMNKNCFENIIKNPSFVFDSKSEPTLFENIVKPGEKTEDQIENKTSNEVTFLNNTLNITNQSNNIVSELDVNRLKMTLKNLINRSCATSGEEKHTRFIEDEHKSSLSKPHALPVAIMEETSESKITLKQSNELENHDDKNTNVEKDSDLDKENVRSRVSLTDKIVTSGSTKHTDDNETFEKHESDMNLDVSDPKDNILPESSLVEPCRASLMQDPQITGELPNLFVEPASSIQTTQLNNVPPVLTAEKMPLELDDKCSKESLPLCKPISDADSQNNHLSDIDTKVDSCSNLDKNLEQKISETADIKVQKDDQEKLTNVSLVNGFQKELNSFDFEDVDMAASDSSNKVLIDKIIDKVPEIPKTKCVPDKKVSTKSDISEITYKKPYSKVKQKSITKRGKGEHLPLHQHDGYDSDATLIYDDEDERNEARGKHLLVPLKLTQTQKLWKLKSPIVESTVTKTDDMKTPESIECHGILSPSFRGENLETSEDKSGQSDLDNNASSEHMEIHSEVPEADKEMESEKKVEPICISLKRSNSGKKRSNIWKHRNENKKHGNIQLSASKWDQAISGPDNVIRADLTISRGIVGTQSVTETRNKHKNKRTILSSGRSRTRRDSQDLVLKNINKIFPKPRRKRSKDEDDLPTILPPKRRRQGKSHVTSDTKSEMDRIKHEFSQFNWLEKKYKDKGLGETSDSQEQVHSNNIATERKTSVKKTKNVPPGNEKKDATKKCRDKNEEMSQDSQHSTDENTIFRDSNESKKNKTVPKENKKAMDEQTSHHQGGSDIQTEEDFEDESVLVIAEDFEETPTSACIDVNVPVNTLSVTASSCYLSNTSLEAANITVNTPNRMTVDAMDERQKAREVNISPKRCDGNTEGSNVSTVISSISQSSTNSNITYSISSERGPVEFAMPMTLNSIDSHGAVSTPVELSTHTSLTVSNSIPASSSSPLSSSSSSSSSPSMMNPVSQHTVIVNNKASEEMPPYMFSTFKVSSSRSKEVSLNNIHTTTPCFTSAVQNASQQSITSVSVANESTLMKQNTPPRTNDFRNIPPLIPVTSSSKHNRPIISKAKLFDPEIEGTYNEIKQLKRDLEMKNKEVAQLMATIKGKEDNLRSLLLSTPLAQNKHQPPVTGINLNTNVVTSSITQQLSATTTQQSAITSRNSLSVVASQNTVRDFAKVPPPAHLSKKDNTKEILRAIAANPVNIPSGIQSTCAFISRQKPLSPPTRYKCDTFNGPLPAAHTQKPFDEPNILDLRYNRSKSKENNEHVQSDGKSSRALSAPVGQASQFSAPVDLHTSTRPNSIGSISISNSHSSTNMQTEKAPTVAFSQHNTVHPNMHNRPSCNSASKPMIQSIENQNVQEKINTETAVQRELNDAVKRRQLLEQRSEQQDYQQFKISKPQSIVNNTVGKPSYRGSVPLNKEQELINKNILQSTKNATLPVPKVNNGPIVHTLSNVRPSSQYSNEIINALQRTGIPNEAINGRPKYSVPNSTNFSHGQLPHSVRLIGAATVSSSNIALSDGSNRIPIPFEHQQMRHKHQPPTVLASQGAPRQSIRPMQAPVPFQMYHPRAQKEVSKQYIAATRSTNPQCLSEGQTAASTRPVSQPTGHAQMASVRSQQMIQGQLVPQVNVPQQETVRQPITDTRLQEIASSQAIQRQANASVQQDQNSKVNHIFGSCIMCGKFSLYLCSTCQNIWYCSQQCQLKHWTTHQHECKHTAVN